MPANEQIKYLLSIKRFEKERDNITRRLKIAKKQKSISFHKYLQELINVNRYIRILQDLVRT